MPAWWAVGAPTPPSGEAGATDADHTGSLFQVGTVADGLVYVEADDHVQAAGTALSGSVNVTLDDQSVVYGFGPETVGLSGRRRPFAVGDWAEGGPVELRLEDLAYLPGLTPDCDYDDRTWSVTIAQA